MNTIHVLVKLSHGFHKVDMNTHQIKIDFLMLMSSLIPGLPNFESTILMFTRVPYLGNCIVEKVNRFM